MHRGGLQSLETSPKQGFLSFFFTSIYGYPPKLIGSLDNFMVALENDLRRYSRGDQNDPDRAIYSRD